jgi:hypothetical protein
MTGLLLDGRWMDALLALIAVEGVALLLWRAWSGRGPSAAMLVANLSSGGFLLLAARLAAAGASEGLVGAALVAALGAHLFDLRNRWRSSAPREPQLSGPAKLSQAAGNEGRVWTRFRAGPDLT